MKLIHFRYQNQNHFGTIDDYRQLATSFGRLGHELPASVGEIIDRWEQFDFKSSAAERELSLDDIVLLPPVCDVGKVICIGRNYAEHAQEMNSTVANLPVVFNKFPSCIIGTQEPVRLPSVSKQVDYEAELVVVIGRGGRDIDLARARRHVFGFCCGNDVTARDWQKDSPGEQWLLGKSMDTFAPLGPWLVTAEEVDDENLDIELRLNGQTMQKSNTRHLIFKVDFLVAHLSKFMTLAPGDLLFTGTPAGVGAGRQPPQFLQAGDTVEVEITGLGLLKNPVIADR